VESLRLQLNLASKAVKERRVEALDVSRLAAVAVEDGFKIT
jgi:hypothetical protein